MDDGAAFRWTGNHYQLHLDTKAFEPGRWRLSIDVGDGRSHATVIDLR